MQIDPTAPPHKTKRFWYIVALAIIVCVGYPLIERSHGPLWSHVIASLLTFITAVSIAWFAVRRVQRGESYFTPRRIVVRVALLIFAIICFILA